MHGQRRYTDVNRSHSKRRGKNRADCHATWTIVFHHELLHIHVRSPRNLSDEKAR